MKSIPFRIESGDIAASPMPAGSVYHERSLVSESVL
jgi:hypothetical protein